MKSKTKEAGKNIFVVAPGVWGMKDLQGWNSLREDIKLRVRKNGTHEGGNVKKDSHVWNS